MNDVYSKYDAVISIDHTKLVQLTTLGKELDEDVLGQLVALHKETSDTILSEMNQCLNEKKFLELRSCAHKFKSNSATLGLMKLHKMCADLETNLKDSLSSNSFEINHISKFVKCIEFETKSTYEMLFQFQKVG